MYAAGLRVAEACRLRVQDIDSPQMVLRVQGGKGARTAVLRHLVACRTAALGGHVDACTRCGFVRISCNSCRDRHCPKCQATRREQWIEARLDRVLPVEHFHVVFTVPDELNPLMLRNRAAVYHLLFAATSRTLLELADDPNRLGAQIGLTAILHTWGQNLLFQTHLHCVVTAGGLSPEGERWVPARQDYLLPVKVLGRPFRGKFLAGLNALYREGGLAFAGSTAHLGDPRVFAGLRSRRRVSSRLPAPSSGIPRPLRRGPAPCHAPGPPLPSCPSEHDNAIAASPPLRPARGFVQQAVSAMLATRDGRNRLICSRAGANHARTHQSLDRNSPVPRDVEPPANGRVVATAYLGGLHHRYSRAA